jgi:hypothetical protein
MKPRLTCAEDPLITSLAPGLRSPGTFVSGRRALCTLAEAGLRSAGCIAGDMTPAVSAAAGQGGRIGRIPLSPMLAGAVVPGFCQVHVSGTVTQASDYRKISVRPGLTQVRFPAMRAGR